MTRAAENILPLDRIGRARAEFPALDQRVHEDRPLVYLDTASSALKPRPVIEAVSHFMGRDYANIHRGVYSLSQRSTTAFEAARARVARFIGAASDQEIVFTRNATEAINLVAASWGMANLAAGDDIVLSELEHHANIVPWQMLRDRIGVKLTILPVDDAGQVVLDDLERLITARTRLVAISQMSNALGTIVPLAPIIARARSVGAAVLVDGCQGVVHAPTDVAALGCDFYVFSGHKLYGPSGIGVLWARGEVLKDMPPYQGGGDMIEHVSFEKTTYAPPPARFEAGTPAIAEAVGLHAALDWLEGYGFEAIAAHEADLAGYATERLGEVADLRLIGRASEKGGIFSFVLGDIHAHDVATILDKTGVCVRSGHHCAHPLMDRLKVTATVRASLGIHNNRADIDALVDGLRLAADLFG